MDVSRGGNFVVDFDRHNGKLASVTFRSIGSNLCRLRYGGGIVDLSTKPGKVVHLDVNL